MVSSVSTSSTSSTSSTASTSSSSASTQSASANASGKSTSATAAANVIKAMGAGSGIDIQSLAQSLVDAEKIPRQDAINKNISKNQAVISGYAAVKYALNNVKTAFDDLKNVSGLTSINASTNQSDVFTATTTTSAALGSHSILVTQLAQSQRSGSTQTFKLADSPIDGLTSIYINDPGRTSGNGIPVPQPPTPTRVVQAINQAGKGLNAQLVNTGNGYKIVVTGATGKSNAFLIESNNGAALDFGGPTSLQGQTSTSAQTFPPFGSDPITSGSLTLYPSLNGEPAPPITLQNPTVADFIAAVGNAKDASGKDLGLRAVQKQAGKILVNGPSGSQGAFELLTDKGDALRFDQTQAASDNGSPAVVLQAATDASLQVDGIEIKSSTNSVSDAIGGVTLALIGTNAAKVNGASQATGGAASLTLTNDTSVAKTKLQALVTAYNDANGIFNEVTNSKSTLPTYGGTLVGNSSSVRSLRDQLRTMITGKDTPGSSFRDIGISVDRTGNLTVNTVSMDLALNFNYAKTVTLLTGNQENQASGDTAPSGLAGDASKALDKMLGAQGTPTLETANANTRISKYQDDLTALDDRMSMLLARYQKQFAAMDALVGQTKNTQTGLTSTFAGMMAMYTNK